MIVEELKKSILQQAFIGNLSSRKPSDSDAKLLLDKIKEIKDKNIKEKKYKKTPLGAEIQKNDIKYEIPYTWSWVRFIDLCSVLTCGYASTPQYVEDGMPFLSAKNIKPYEFKPQEYKKINYDLYEKLIVNCKPEKNDILLTRVGAGIGEAAIIDTNMEFAIYVSLTLIKLVSYDLINNKYILYWLNSPYGLLSSIKNTTGKESSQGNLNVDNVRNFLVPFPPVEEQNRIIDKIEELFAKLDELKPIEEELIQIKEEFPKEMKKSIIQSGCSGKLSIQREMESALDLIKKIEKKINHRIKTEYENIPFSIPQNWCWIKFDDLVNFNIGKTPPRADLTYWGNDYNWVSISDMVDDGVIDETKEKVSSKAADDVFKNRISPKGTLIMSFKLTVGRCSILNIDSFHNEGIISIFPYIESEILKKYLMKVLPFITKYGDKKGAIKGDTLNSKSLKNLLIPLPPIEEQQRIVDKIEELLPLCDDIDKIVGEK